MKLYRYYDKDTHSIDFEGMMADLEKIENEAIVVMQPCGHNPTGCDPTIEQWDDIIDLVIRKRLMVFFDNAYQGFATADIDRDGYAIQKLAEKYDRFMVS